MQVEIDGLHEQALLRLMQRNSEKTGIGMTRILIRDAAKEAGIWTSVLEEGKPSTVSVPEVAEAVA